VSKRRVAVVFGGRSAEHEISCISARAVIDALDPVRFDVVAIGITRDGRWRILDGPPALPAETGRMPQVGDGDGAAVELASRAAGHELVSEHGGSEPIDVVFPVLHGPFGEDGAFQGFLELAGVPYVGAGVLGSAVGMDKVVQKALLADAGLPVVAHEGIREHEWRDDPDAVTARVLALGLPVFVKPAALGSSVGIAKVGTAGDLPASMDDAFRYGRKVIVERAVDRPREIECAVLGNDDPVASVPGEIVPRGEGFYDYEAKYLDEDGAELRVPAPLEPAVADEVRRMAVLAFTSLEGAGMARVDFFIDAGGAIWVNEINTIPGFTPISMYPKLWAESGLAYPELIARLLELAEERHAAEHGKERRARELGTAPSAPRGGRPGR
jgi:D-alanine-D-alanine ligase